MSTYTVRGTLEHNVEERIILFDGRFDTGYVVKEFYLYPNSGIGAGNDSFGVIYTEPGTVASGVDWDWGENYQIGWATGANSGTTSTNVPNGIVDPDNLIIEDLYIIAQHGGSGTTGYMIVLEKFNFSDDLGALAMVRNRSQA